jgi:CheY-like chemotaxis protein
MPKNLLLADDSRTIQQAVSMTFAGEDVKLTAVADGEAALQAAKQSKPDLILADVSMPKLGGYELCQRVRADAALKDVPVLLLGGGIPVDPAKAIAVGANGHMPKPFDSGKLIEQVKNILANPKAKPVIAPVASAPPRPAAPPARPSAPPPGKPAISPGGIGAGSTMVMARPPVPGVPGSRPPAPVPPRPSAPPPAARPPTAPLPMAAKPATPVSKPPASAPPMAARPASAPGVARPPAPAPRPSAPPPARPAPPAVQQPPAALDDDEDIPLDDEIVDTEETAAPPPTPLRPIPSSAHKPALSVVPPPGDGGEAVLREALSKASREVIEKIAWEVVPELAETIIREELERLIKERGA